MTRRVSQPYAEREVKPVYVEGQVAISEPVAGFYRMSLGRGSVDVGIKLWFGPPSDPITGELLDRGYRWQALADDEPMEFEAAWPKCAGDPISAQEYRRLVARKAWAREHAPDSSYAQTGRRRDPLSTREPTPF